MDRQASEQRRRQTLTGSASATRVPPEITTTIYPIWKLYGAISSGSRLNDLNSVASTLNTAGVQSVSI